MPLVIPYASEVTMLKNIFNHTAPQDQELKLFKSNTTPAETDVAGTHTEADFTGYSAAALSGASWGFTEGGAGSPSISFASYAQQTFTSTAGSQNQPIYGYFVEQAISGLLLFAERFDDGPYTINNIDDAVKVTPIFTLD